MKQIFLAAILIVGLASCDPEEVDPPSDGEFRLNFSMNWEGQALELNEFYENVSGYNVSLETIKFYISNIQLVKNDNSIVDLSDIELYNLNEDEMTSVFLIPDGDYKGIKYAWGVSQDLNGTLDPDNFDPVIYVDDHPLNLDNGMYWVWATGYRFFIFDGRFDLTPSTTTDTPENLSIHVGTDTTYTPVDVTSTNFSFDRSKNVDYNISVDISRAFYSQTDTINLALPEDNQAHQTNIQLSERLIQNIKNATSHSVN